MGDVAGRPPQSVADPSPFSSSDGDFNLFLVCTLPQLLIRNLSGPPPSQDVPESASNKGLKLGDDLLCQHPDPYRRADFTLELKILIFVHREMKFDLHIGLKMENATCAFLHLASTSSSVPPVVVTRLPRYVKADTCSRTSPAQLMLPVFAGDRILISLVLDALILRPTLAACSTSVANFCLMWVIF